MLTRLYTAPEAEPISLLEAKTHLRLEHALDDTHITTVLIPTAREKVEEILWRGVVTQAWEGTLDAFPVADEIRLPRGGLVSITSITYVDVNGATQTLATTEYEADTVSEPGMVRLAYGKSWPSTRDQWNAVTIRWVVGWAVASVPKPIKQAMLLLISHYYEHREPVITGTIVAQIPDSVDALLAPYRLMRWS